MKRFIIAIDEGTTSTKAVLFDTKNNEIVKVIKREFKQYFPENGWVEHDADEIYKLTLKNIEDLFVSCKLTADDVIGIGITNQRETVVAFDKLTAKPIVHAIVWQDRRTASYCKNLKKEKREFIKKKTGLIVDSYFSATKMRWLIKNDPNVKEYKQNGRLLFGTIDTYLIYRLTNKQVFATDTTNASRTMLTSLNNPFNWDNDLLKLFSVPKSSLAEIKNCADDYGVIKTKFGDIKILSVIGDQQSSLFGQACTAPMSAKITYGTGAFILVNVGDKPKNSTKKLLSTTAWSIDNKTTYAIEGSVFNVGSAINYLKNDLGFFKTFKEADEMIELANNNPMTCFIPAFTGLGAPHWVPSARGAIIGLTLDTKKEDIVKSCYESFAFLISDIFEYLNENNIKIKSLSIDGGLSKTKFLAQFQSDLLNTPLMRAGSEESTALGAIYMAGIKDGIYTLNDIKSLTKIKDSFSPNITRQERAKQLLKWKDAIKRIKIQ